MTRTSIVFATAVALVVGPSGQELSRFIDVPVMGDPAKETAQDEGSKTFAFRGAPRCGDDGAVLLVQVSQGGATASRLVHIDRSGHRTVIDLTAVVSGASNDLQVVASTVGQLGQLYALVDLGDPARRAARKVVAISAAGAVLWARDIDESSIHVKDIAALPSGDVLLVGVQPLDAVAVTATLDRSGAQGAARLLPGTRPPGSLAAVANAVGTFVVDDSNNRVVQIGGDHAVVHEFSMARPSPEARLIGAQLAGSHLATLHADIAAQGQGVRRFVSVQDTSSGELLRTLGPFDRMVVCYAVPDQHDEVTLLSVTKSGWVLRRGTS